MKKIALLILILFAAVQTIPAVQSFFAEGKALIFNVDEEKNVDKTAPDEIKEKKEYPAYDGLLASFTNKMAIAFHLAEAILPFPCVEKLTPPPNFC